MSETVLMVTHGSLGDVLPFVRVGEELARRGCAVTLLSHAGYARYAGPDIEFVAIDTVAEHRRGMDQSASLRDVRRPADLEAFYRAGNLYERTHRELAELVGRNRAGRTVLVGRHTSAASVLFAAELLGVPACWVALAPSQLMVAPVAAAHHRHALAAGFAAVRERFGLGPVKDWNTWFRSPSAVIGTWPEWFDTAGRPAGPGVALAGFVLGDEPGEATGGTMPAVLPAGGVLVTGGTGRMLHPGFYPAALAALAAAGRPGLVVTPHRDLLPARLPPGVRWQAEAPFAAVLPTCGAVVHHGGIGTAVQALRSGTPQVILADGADRPDNARRLAAYGLAHSLEATGPEGWETDAVAASLTAALAGGPRPVTALRAAADDVMTGARRAADLITASQDHGGPEADTPADLRRRLHDLTPRQRQLLAARLRPGTGE
ncbi:glycosyltransferase [Actinoplanes utahensis]|uniref:Erythromycin biosynthesis protein CIII-like C-terminal domain-containing protein n=1 Tax=Actinoplanes utahensis TaxID=1869 RepID=A0A0A6UQ60_ACTUT|nr:nucleotide disphospho-sugar-binding domain-containing protein [Actinoplanes utahensis]KHD78270.1 hypothetical protein MB27_05335 [Actinoplanes utahensis]GIF28867.1 hypothetical protein Aut01nite_18530 [Actinoplanes utahensis]